MPKEELIVFPWQHNDLQQSIVKAFKTYDRVSVILEEDRTGTAGSAETSAKNGPEATANVARLATGAPPLLFRTEILSETNKPRSSASVNLHLRPSTYKIHRYCVAYVTLFSD